MYVNVVEKSELKSDNVQPSFIAVAEPDLVGERSVTNQTLPVDHTLCGRIKD